MLRMLIVGFCYGMRFERRLCQEVELHLAYRWFSRDPQNRRKPSIYLDQEPAIVVRQPDPALHLTPQNDQLMSENRILCLKSALRLEWRSQDGQDEAEQCEHRLLTLSDSVSSSMRMRFSVQTGGRSLGLPRHYRAHRLI
jgi:hypothetical protein